MARVLPVVVIVEDRASYLEAIAAWTPTRRFPVLIDDGSPQSAEDLARFVAGFAPTRVVRWSSAPDAGTPADAPAPPASREDKAKSFAFAPIHELHGAVHRAWDLPADAPPAKFVEHLRELSKATRAPEAPAGPLGVVLVHPDDQAWAAGVAVAAARGQALLWVQFTQGFDGAMSVRDADDLAQRIDKACDELGLSWKDLGDEIDALTLAINAPSRIERKDPNPAAKGATEFLAITDRLGRVGNDLAKSPRWAWTGQLAGDARRSAYRAMCAIFLDTRSAWLFDGYADAPPFSDYDATKAGETLTKQGWRVEVMDAPAQGATDWRTRAERPVDAGAILVTTMGNSDFFDLRPGQCRPGDLPILARPTAAYFVHSWSALFPSLPNLLSGRWLQRGAYLYVGSVHEPYLQGFVPTPKVATRLAMGLPWGVAVRYDAGPVWKINVLGDPLTQCAPALVRSDDPLPLPSATSVEDGLRDALKAGRHAQAFRALLLAGKSEPLAQLGGAMLRAASARDADTPTLDSDACELLITPLFLHATLDELTLAMDALTDDAAKRPELWDALWHKAQLGRYLSADAKPAQRLLDVLARSARFEEFGRDATTLAAVISRHQGEPKADAFLRELQQRTTDPELRRRLDAAMKQPRSTWGR